MQKPNNTTEYFPAAQLRETLRQQAVALATKLSRSVARLTSCDALPCVEYGDEVFYERMLAEKLFYTQQCRNALEDCIANGRTTLRYHWSDNTVTITRFRKIGPNRIKIIGLAKISQDRPQISMDFASQNAIQ